MAGQRGERTFYRIVETDPPTLDDFLTDRAKGKKPPRDPANAHLYDGLSAYRTLKQARNKARDFYPLLGTFVAELRIPADSAIRSPRTLKKTSRGHHTLFGSPEELLACVVAVFPVPASDNEA